VNALLTCDLDVKVCVQQQIFCLQITMDNTSCMTIRDCSNDLLELESSVMLSHATMRHQVI